MPRRLLRAEAPAGAVLEQAEPSPPPPDEGGRSADERGLRVEGVSVRFGGLTALDEVSLDVGAGEVVGVIGPNGAGKTTLFNVVCGFVAPDEGTVRWRGKSLARVRPHHLAELGIARTLQGVGLFPQLSALENVMVGAEHRRRAGFTSALLGLPRSDKDERALREQALAALDDARRGRRRRPDAGARSPTPCRSASRWPARWSPSPTCCCSTSPPAGSAATTWPSSASSSARCASG